MRIVQLANFHTPTSGGLRTVLDELGRRYVEAGHRVQRVVPGEYDEVIDLHGVQEIRLRAPLLPGGSGYRMLVDVGRVDELLRRLRPEAIELSDKTTLVRSAGRRARIGATVVSISHERIDAILGGRAPSWVPLVRVADHRNARVARVSQAVVCCSEFAAHEFRRIGATNVRRVPLGVDLSTFRPALQTDRSASVAAARPIELVTVGRLSPEKRPAHAVHVLRRLIDDGRAAHLTIIGDGPLRAELERLSVGLPVTFLGHVASRAALAEVLAAADVCISPCAVETFGLSALEAMACGTPVVVPDAGALHELIADQPSIGRVVTDGDAARWSVGAAAAVTDLMRRDVRSLARTHAERFSWEAAAEAMLSLMVRERPRHEGQVSEDGRVSLATVG